MSERVLTFVLVQTSRWGIGSLFSKAWTSFKSATELDQLDAEPTPAPEPEYVSSNSPSEDGHQGAEQTEDMDVEQVRDAAKALSIRGHQLTNQVAQHAETPFTRMAQTDPPSALRRNPPPPPPRTPLRFSTNTSPHSWAPNSTKSTPEDRCNDLVKFMEEKSLKGEAISPEELQSIKADLESKKQAESTHLILSFHALLMYHSSST